MSQNKSSHDPKPPPTFTTRLQAQYMIQLSSLRDCSGKVTGMRQKYHSQEKDAFKAGLTLAQLLAQTYCSNITKATDPKDFIYALFGMASDREIRTDSNNPDNVGNLGDSKKLIEPNYKLWCDQIYIQSALRIIVDTKQVDLLSFSQKRKANFLNKIILWIAGILLFFRNSAPPDQDTDPKLKSWVSKWIASLLSSCENITRFHNLPRWVPNWSEEIRRPRSGLPSQQHSVLPKLLLPKLELLIPV
jgi:hypothetical protein